MKTVTINNEIWEICDNEQFEKQNNKYDYKSKISATIQLKN